MERTAATSAHQASAILLAWQVDIGWFHREVDAVAGLIPSQSNTGEMERIDLLNSVAGELRRSKAPFTDPGMDVCRDLLRHLASQVPPSAT